MAKVLVATTVHLLPANAEPSRDSHCCTSIDAASNPVATYANKVGSENSQIFEVLRMADAVCFDVDSTVCTGEGIDELAEYCGVFDEVKKLTSQAMDGNTPFHTSLQMRLNIIKPSINQIKELIHKKPLELSPHVDELVALLHSRGVDVYLVSGGFTHMIYPLASKLSIPKEKVYANELQFDAKGDFAGYNTQCFTSAAGGKARALQHIRAINGYTNLVMVGDGATDLEARCPGGADMFVGYGGNVEREKVKEGSDWYVRDFKEVISMVTMND